MAGASKIAELRIVRGLKQLSRSGSLSILGRCKFLSHRGMNFGTDWMREHMLICITPRCSPLELRAAIYTPLVIHGHPLVSGGSVVVHHVVHHGGGFYSGSPGPVAERSAAASVVSAQTTRIPRPLRAAA